jgi:hypothetical protein
VFDLDPGFSQFGMEANTASEMSVLMCGYLAGIRPQRKSLAGFTF